MRCAESFCNPKYTWTWGREVLEVCPHPHKGANEVKISPGAALKIARCVDCDEEELDAVDHESALICCAS